RLNGLLARNAEPINQMMLNLLDSHDTNRFYSEVRKDMDRYLVALAILFFYEGVPCLYYGDEALMEGGYDPDSRRGFRPDTKNEAFSLIRFLSRMRKRGDFASARFLVSSSDGLLLLERRGTKADYVLAVHKGPGEVAYEAKEVLWSAHYRENRIGSFGFVVDRRRK
ncbi:MAG: alpha-amylase family glycosyl hydrolase, partial [Candidatus Enteromonas sp.]